MVEKGEITVNVTNVGTQAGSCLLLYVTDLGSEWFELSPLNSLFSL